MIPSPEQMARQMAAMVILHPDKTTSEIAQELMYPTLFMINAVREGERMELFKEIKEDDKLMLISPPDMQPAAFGEEIELLQLMIHIFLKNIEQDEEDIELGQLRFWLRGVRESAIDIALLAMKNTGSVEEYDITDPRDPESTYQFLTLRQNLGKTWGMKQFKQTEPEPKAPKKKKK